MTSIKILVPQETTNYVKNPSFRYETTPWESTGATLTRTLEYARFGVAGAKIVTNGAALHEGINYRISWLDGVESVLTASVYLRGSGKVRIRLADNISGDNWNSKFIVLTDKRWQRIDVTGRCHGGNDVRLYIETDDLPPKALTFYADGAQVEPLPYSSTYCDGDQDNCRWNIMAHNSISTRSAYVRSGGRWAQLADDDCDPDKTLYITTIGGLGTAPIQNNIQNYADSPGSFFQGSRVLNRVFTILFHALSGMQESLEALHSLRKSLFDVIRPDKTSGNEEFVLEYKEGDLPLCISARYEAGMEGEWDIRNKWFNSFPLRFVAVSPFFTSDDQNTAALNFVERATVNYVAQRVDGEWSEMNGGMNNIVYDFAVGRNGEIYACGLFNKSNNKATAIDPEIFSNFVAYWDGTQWRGLGSGANGIINSIAIAPNGDVIATGAFTSIGGVAASRIARYSITAGTWSALGAGLGNGAGFTVKVAPNGDVFVGGSFTQAGGLNAYYFARYDGAWHPLGTYLGLNNIVYSIDITPNGKQIYLGGLFTDEYTSPAITPLYYICLYEVDYNEFFALGEGFDATVLKVVVAPSGYVYASGEFTESQTSAQILLYIAYWNGAAWFDLAGGADNTVRNMTIDKNGTVVAVGDFARIGSTDARGIALWNNSTWVNLDIEIDANGYAAIWDYYGNLFISFDGVLMDHASITTVENSGSAEVSPIIYIIGPCTLRWIENQTAQKRIYMDLDVLDDEEVFIDLSKGTIESVIRGNLAYAIHPGSDMRAWKLIPGNNRISALAIDDVAATMRILHSPRYWSADSSSYNDGEL